MAIKTCRGWTLALALAAAFPPLAPARSCPPEGWTRADLDSLRAAEFRVADGARRSTLALGLLDCLGAPDPGLRDGIAFEAWSAWLRAGDLDETSRRLAVDRLLPRLRAGADAAGFAAPFAALVLSEIVRTDRIHPWMTPAERERVLTEGVEYLSGVRDYRGFDERKGWRHGVAHGADLMLQLALDPALDKAQLDRLLAAVATQVAPAGQAYVYGEPERLARPVLYAALRGLHSQAEWDSWFAALATPGAAATWREAVATQAGLARRHDLRAFLLAIYVEIADEQRAPLVAMRPAVLAALKRVP